MNLKNLKIASLVLNPLENFPKNDKQHKYSANMAKYLDKNKNLFNKSQYDVLKRVISAQQDSITLVQGPPGTGKTHTIIGMVSMLMDAGVKRIHLCTPSNKAVDEIISRLSQRGFIGEHTTTDFTKIDLKENLLRVGSCEYQASPVVKQHSLDVRINKLLKPAIAKLEDELAIAKEIIQNQFQDIEIFDFFKMINIDPF